MTRPQSDPSPESNTQPLLRQGTRSNPSAALAKKSYEEIQREKRWVNDVQFQVIAYRELTDAEVMQRINMFTLDHGPQRPGFTVTIATTIGRDEGSAH